MQIVSNVNKHLIDRVDVQILRRDVFEIDLVDLRGGLHMDRLKGIHRLILSAVRKANIRQLEGKERTAQEEDDLALWKKGGSRFDENALLPVLGWYQSCLKKNHE